MTSWCIVAIPEESDPVWQTSSEKIPHCTLLFLGEQDDSEKAILISQQLQHTIDTSLHPFYLDVNSRGVLGDKDADVLFFDQAKVPKQLVEFRSLLLKDDTIRTAYDSAEQYPSWTPHLTLGYPDSPAKKPLVDPNTPFNGRFHSIYFDRIALWISDYDGPTFNMQYDDMSVAADLMMSDATVEFLTHGTQRSETRSLMHSHIGVRMVDYKAPIHDALAPAIKLALTSSVSIDSGYLEHAESEKIHQQYIEANQRSFAKHLDKVVGGRPSERANRQFDISTHPTGDWLVSSVDTVARHGTIEARVRPVTDDQGLIVDYDVAHDAITEDDIRYALIHWGVKGMKWGVRRNSSSSGSSAGGSSGSGGASGSTEGMSKRQEKKAAKAAARKQELRELIKRPVTEDAADAASKRGRTKKHGTDALSNDELKALVQRMNLEQQFAALKENEKAAKGRNSGRAYVGDLLKDVGNEMAKEAVKYAATEGIKFAFNQSKSAASESRWANQASQLALNSKKPQLAIGR